MDRRARKRISKIESRLSRAQKLVVYSGADIFEMAVKDRWCSDAQHHMTAVAAIAKFGEPKIDEPLELAWQRTLLRHNISIPDGCKNDLQFASQELHSAIIGDTDEIFSSAPTWLLDFTWMRCDAYVLGLVLPTLSGKPTRTGCTSWLFWP
jgi:hypothetical protein